VSCDPTESQSMIPGNCKSSIELLILGGFDLY
jgi:hypothetical protein